jgi:polysaccharide export outer membrane protein
MATDTPLSYNPPSAEIMDFRKMIRILLFLGGLIVLIPVYSYASDNGVQDQWWNKSQPEAKSSTPMVPPPPKTGPGRVGVLSEEDSPYEYRIGVQDLLEIQVFQAEELNHVSRVNTRGHISMPLIGSVQVIGLMVEDAERLIESKLGEEYLQDPHVTIFVKEYESQKITVEGWVKDPGVFPLKGQTTLVQAIAMADGLDRLADPEQITIFRKTADGKTMGYTVNVERVRTGDINDPLVYHGDIIVIPKHGGKAFVDDITRTLRGFIGFGTL